MIDDKLKLDCHTTTLCRKIAQSSLEFCSTLFFDLKSSSETDRLDKFFIKLCKTIEANQTSTKNCVALNLTEQAFILSKFEILPRCLRVFYLFILYTYVNYIIETILRYLKS
jgi:hypothetical protein